MSQENNDKKSRKVKYKINNSLFSEEDFLKDCPNNKFVPTILPPVKRVIAIGDIHGDLQLAIRSFRLAKLIDENLNWVAKPPDTIVVQVGDQIDSCRFIPGVYDCHDKKYPEDQAEDMKVLDFFNSMDQKASKVGGAVYSLLGNHELMNAQGIFDYVSHDNFHQFKYKNDEGQTYEGSDGRKRAFEPGGPVSKMLACTRPSVLIVGSTMFVHAGVLPVLAKRLDHLGIDNESKLKYLNAIIRKWLLNKLSERTDKENSKLFLGDQKRKNSPFWTRIYGSIPENVPLDSSYCFDSIKKAIEVYRIGHMVVGHTPQLFTNKNGINGTCYELNGDKKVYRVDGGFSRAFRIFDNNDLVQVLEIIDDKEFNIITDKNIQEYLEPPETGINQNQMEHISYIYSQNRIFEKNKQTKKFNKKMIY